MTKNEIEMLKNAIDSHLDRLFRDYEAYRKTDNKEAQIDCLLERKKYLELKQKLPAFIFSDEQRIEIQDDAVSAIIMSGNDITFDEWAPAWMLNEKGEQIEDNDRLDALRYIWGQASVKNKY